MKKLPTVTVAISAFNEENNVGPFLRSVLSQKEAGFKLEKILIYNDGSADKTSQVVRSFKDPRIVLHDSKERTGKSTRLNQIYAELSSDFLVQSDADVVFSQPYLIRDMIAPMIADPSVWMCGGNPKPVLGKTFTEKAVNCTFNVYAPLRSSWKNGNNALSSDGRMLSYRREMVKKITVPANTTSNDAYTYFCTRSLGHDYRFVPSAVVYFRSPQTLKDQIKQNTRFLACPIRMSRYFDPELVKREKVIPKRIMIPAMLKQFVRHPLLCSYIYVVNIYCRLRAKRLEKHLNARWAMAETTKKLEVKKAVPNLA